MSIASIAETTKYLTFTLDGEIFALDITKVREVISSVAVTKVPKTPDFMCGVINLRGGAVPVVDLKLMFGMPHAEEPANSCIIIIEVSLGGEKIVLGVLVDSVQEVFEFENVQIEPPPKIGTKLNTEFIQGMGKRDDRFIVILDIDKVFSAEELEIIHDANGDNPADESQKEI